MATIFSESTFLEEAFGAMNSIFFFFFLRDSGAISACFLMSLYRTMGTLSCLSCVVLHSSYPAEIIEASSGKILLSQQFSERDLVLFGHP